MSQKDHHAKPYSPETLLKLEIFERYVETWLPVFISQKQIKQVSIVDFFSGLGYDKSDIAGSPIRILETIKKFVPYLTKSPTIINLYLNEYNSSKFAELQENCNSFINANQELKRFLQMQYSNNDFDEIFPKIIQKTQNQPSLFLIDQCGIKFMSEYNFNLLQSLTVTDFIFFISSSFLTRFGNSPEFSKHLKIRYSDIKNNPYDFIHRVALQRYRALISKSSKLMLFPFSIKKDANIYGIIFGSKHIRGVEKFLKIAWKKNEINGEANYDIDNDLHKSKPDLFPETKPFTKIEFFEEKLVKYLSTKKIVSNKELYYFTCKQGHVIKHTADILRKLKIEHRIAYKGYPKLSWKKIKELDYVEFKWL